jgi:hypothetical protein
VERFTRSAVAWVFCDSECQTSDRPEGRKGTTRRRSVARFMTLKSNAMDLSQYLSFFERQDMPLFGFYNFKWVCGQLRQLDALFVRRNLDSRLLGKVIEE